MHPPIPNNQFVGQVFNGVLSLMAILIAVVGILLGFHESAQGVTKLVKAYERLIIGTAFAVLIAGGTAGLSLAYLRGRRVSVGLIVRLLILLLVIVTVGPLIVVVIRFQ